MFSVRAHLIDLPWQDIFKALKDLPPILQGRVVALTEGFWSKWTILLLKQGSLCPKSIVILQQKIVCTPWKGDLISLLGIKKLGGQNPLCRPNYIIQKLLSSFWHKMEKLLRVENLVKATWCFSRHLVKNSNTSFKSSEEDSTQTW